MDAKKVTLAVAAGVFATGLIGGAAVASFQPFTPAGPGQAQPQATTATTSTNADDKRKPDVLKKVLDKMVQDGKLTQAQEDQILAGLKDELQSLAKQHPNVPNVKQFIGDLMKATTDYLGISAADLKTQLQAGKSFGQIANATPGKSRDGLVAALTTAANARVDAAQAAGKLTADQATKIKSMLGTQIAQFVDHTPKTASGKH